MKLSNQLKRILAFALALVMVLGMVPVHAHAAQNGNEANTIFFASDRHANPDKLNTLLKNLQYVPGLVVLAGDNVNNQDSYSLASITSEIQAVYPGVQTFYTYGSHDSSGQEDSTNPYAFARTGENYAGDDYYVYAVDQSAMESASAASSASAAFVTWASTVDSSKVIFVVCHMPIHDRRGDNAGGATWMSALNEVGKTHDVVFLWGHNHTGENSTDTSVYFVNVGGSLTPEGGSTGTINFTYMNAGYIKNGYASMVVINDSTVDVTRYSTSGSATANYTIERRFAETHTWEVTEKVEATCTTAGYETKVCTDCGETKTTEIAATGHTYTEEVVNTCTGSSTVYTCTVCGHSYSQANPTVPTYDKASGLVEGESYVIVASNNALTYGSSVGQTSVTVSNDSVTSDVTDAMIWKYTDGKLYNEANEKYIYVSSRSISFSSSNSSSVSYSSSKLKLGSRYLTYSSSAWGGGFSTSSSSGTTVTLYQVNEPVGGTGEHLYETVTVEPTCTTDGYITYTCSACGDTYTEVLKSNGTHSYETVTVEATCETAGSVTYTCACGDTYTEILPSLDHSYEAVVTAPTCTEAGYTTYTCACGDSYVADEVAALGHVYESVTTEAACGKEGSVVYTCRCGDTYTEILPALDHSYEAVVTAPTCTEAGYTTYTCACGDSYVADEVAALGHDYKSVTVEPTCTEAGYTGNTCTICGHTTVSGETPALGHDYEAAVTEATCETAGYTTYTCHCGDSYVADEVAALGHDYVTRTVELTCTEDGFSEHTCSVCGDSYITDFVEAPGHKYTVTVENGYNVYTCQGCGESYSDEVVIHYTRVNYIYAGNTYVITAYSGGKYYALSHSGNQISVVEVKVANSEITTEITDDMKWSYANNKLSYEDNGKTYYLYASGNNKSLVVSSSRSSTVTFSSNRLKIGSYYLRYSNGKVVSYRSGNTAYMFCEV